MKTLTQDKITDGQKKQLTRMIGDIADSDLVQEALDALSKKGAERLKGNSGFVATIRQVITEKIAELGVVNEYANEEVTSNYGYLSGYRKPLDLNAQCNKLRELFSGLGFANQDLQTRIEKGDVKLPANTEGWFAIPNWMKNPKIFGKTYAEAVQKILDNIKKTRDGAFYNYCNGEVDEKHLRQSARSEQFWSELTKAQGDADILIVAAQFGIRHRGRSVRRARVIIEDTKSEFGLGAFAVGSMLLTHPIRLQHYNDLWIDCAGDEWSLPADGVFSGSPYFWFDGVGRVRFGSRDVDDASDCYGSASGSLPQ